MKTMINGVELDIQPSADLRGADLSGANLHQANLHQANLHQANLYGANLRGANLYEANLSGANLSGANLYGADLCGANLSETALPAFQLVPSEGAFITYKAVRGAVLKLRIPADAQRTSSLVGRKCRASHVEVLGVVNSRLPTDTTEFEGLYDRTTYPIGGVVRADSFDPDIRVECTHGIHFFVTQKEAAEYGR